MITLHIEHAITDMETWRAAFDRLEAARKNAGVRTQQVRRPIEDPAYVEIDHDIRGVLDRAPDLLRADAGVLAGCFETVERRPPGLHVRDRVFDVQGDHGVRPPDVPLYLADADVIQPRAGHAPGPSQLPGVCAGRTYPPGVSTIDV